MELAAEDQDKLAQLFGGKLGGNAADLFAAAASRLGANGATTPPAAAGTTLQIPGMPGGMPAASGPTPQASDDPALQPKQPPTSPMPGTGTNPIMSAQMPGATKPPVAAPTLPTVPSFQSPPVGTMQDLSSRIATASQPVRRQDYQPHWWEKLLAPVVAGVEGYGDAKQGIAAGHEILDRRYNRAVENQQKTVTPLEAEFKRQSEIEPYLRDSNANAQHTFEDAHQNYTSFNQTQDRQDAIDQRATAARDRNETRQDEDKNSPAPNARPELYLENGKPALRVKTKSGEYMPYTPKSIDEGAMLGDPTATKLFHEQHREKTPAGDKEASKAKFEQIEKDHQKAHSDAEDEYTNTLAELEQSRKLASRGGKQPPDDIAQRDAAMQRLQQKKDRAERTYQAEIVAAGGKINDADRLPAQSGNAPGSAVSATTKTVPKATVQSYADAHKVGNRQMTYDEALQGFQSKGYKVQ